MKKALQLAIGLTLALAAQAQQTISLTPQTLTGWEIVGADAGALAKQVKLSLPGGAQLSHLFLTNDLGINVTTSPATGQSSADMPVLEIGSVALVFSRDGSTGKLVLLVGDSAPVDLPFSFALDANGRSIEPLTVGFSRKGTVISVTSSGQTLQFPGDQSRGEGLEVVVSSGATQDWEISSFAVTTDGSSQQTKTSGQSANMPNSDSAAKAQTSAAGKSSPVIESALPVGTAGSTGSSAATAPVAIPKITMEVMTPPSFRHGRVDAIRAAVAAKTQ